MFERYTERARRVIFFARYEASNYGSRHIETEHLLLGLLREVTANWGSGFPEKAITNQKFALKLRGGLLGVSRSQLPWRYQFRQNARRC
jgi:hypothetical protein